MTTNKMKLYLDKEPNDFGFYAYRLYGTNDRIVMNGMCDDYEVMYSNVTLYYGDSMSQNIFRDIGGGLEVYIESNGNKEKVTDYTTLE